jgi:creatinine amidohydrolase
VISHGRLPCLAFLILLTQVASQSASGQRGPDTVWLEALTWEEVRQRIADGGTRIIIATAGTEQKGPHLPLGQHRFVLEYTSEHIARAVGNTLVAPIVTYVPEGSWDPPSGHMTRSGTISLPNERFMGLRAGGFTDIILLGDSGGNQDGMREVAARLNDRWRGSGARAHFIEDYYARSARDAERLLTERYGLSSAEIGNHAGVEATSEMLFVNAAYVRRDRLAPGNPENGVSGDPRKASADIGRALVQIKIDNAVAQIRRSLAGERP